MKKTLLLCVFLISSCSMQQVRTDSPNPREEQLRSIVAEAEPLISNLLASLNADDYAGYCRNFDDSAQAACTGEQFRALQEKTTKTLGPYESGKHQVHKIEQYTNCYLLFYFVKFQKVASHNPALMTLRVRETAEGLKITAFSCSPTRLEAPVD